VPPVCHLPLLTAHLTVILESCTAWTSDTLNVIGECWSQELTEVLVYAVDSGMLWDQFGIVGEVAISTFSISHYQVVDHTPHPTTPPTPPLILTISCPLSDFGTMTSLPILQAIHYKVPSGGYL
jgi:hypothetical protein